MNRYLVERTFAPDSPSRGPGPEDPLHPLVVQDHAPYGVTWLRSYLTLDRRRSYCIVDGPSPEAVRHAARASGLPIDRISEVRALERADARATTPASAATPGSPS